MKSVAIIALNLICGYIVVEASIPVLCMNIRKRAGVIMRRNFYLGSKVIYKAMLSLDITGRMMLKILFLLVATHMREDHLQSSRKQIKPLGLHMKRLNFTASYMP